MIFHTDLTDFPFSSVCDLEASAALHTEGAENGGEDSDDEIDDFLDSFLFHGD